MNEKMSTPSIDRALASLVTHEERDALYEALSALEKSIYQENGALEYGARAEKLFPRVMRTLEDIQEHASKIQGHAEKKDFFESVRAVLSKIPLLILDVGYVPDKETEDAIAAWVQKEIGERMLLAIKTDAALFGGVRLIWKGKYREYGLRARVEEAIKTIGISKIFANQ